MNSVIHKKMKLFILAIIVLIALCFLFINHYSNIKLVNIDNFNNIVNTDINDTDDKVIIADSTIKKNKIAYDHFKNVEIKVKINNQHKQEYIVASNDVVTLEIEGLNKDYKVYYSLQGNNINTEYKEYNENFLLTLDTPEKFNLVIKLVVLNSSKEYNLGEFRLYDIIYENQPSISNSVEIGNIYTEEGEIYINEDGSEYLYDDMSINKNIVIDNIEIEDKDDINNNEKKDTLNGNIHVIEETNLDEFDINGYIFIDTEENVTLSEDIFIDTNIYSVTIQSKNFVINDKTYYYEINDDQVIINDDSNEVINVNEIFNESVTDINENNELVIKKDEIDSSF